MDTIGHEVFRFEGFTLDVMRGVVRDGDREIELRPKSFDVLRCLIERAGRLVTRDEVIETVWPSVVVTDESVTRCVSDIRSALGDNDQKLIRTVHRRGYLFTAPVSSAVSPAPRPESATARRPHAEAERRQLTVMCCELICSSSSVLDPEDMHEVVGVYHRCLAENVARFCGLVTKRLGNTSLVLFGYPVAHEDDPELAVRAGLDLCSAINALAPKCGALLHGRVGIATGPVIVGDQIDIGDTREHAIIGDAPNMAGRLQVLAQPGTVAVDEVTRRLVGGLFDCHDLGPIKSVGSPDPIPVWQVVGPGSAVSRFEALRSRTLTPFVGRDEEMELLTRRWQQAQAGEGRVVLLSGEPGLGKSRIVETLLERIAPEPYVDLRYFCSPRHMHSPLYPFVAQVERAAGFIAGDSARTKLDKLEFLLASSCEDSQTFIALMAELLGVPGEQRYPALANSPQQKKETTLSSLLGQFAALAVCKPVLIVVEDMHWIDPTSLELLDRIIAQIADMSVLLIVTYRPEFRAPWIGQPHVTVHTLSRLGRRDAATLMLAVSGAKLIPKNVTDQILDRTDGVPLFIEELTKSTLESNLGPNDATPSVSTASSSARSVPAALHAPLMARLDALGPIKDIVQVASAIGREFSFDLLSAVVGRSSEELRRALETLVDAGILHQRGSWPHAIFMFKHALIQDAAYDTLLRGPRQQLHARIADVLSLYFPEVASSLPEVLAQHYSSAGLTQQEVAFWRAAGERSVSRSSLNEAIAHFANGLSAISRLENDPRRHELELDFRLNLAAVLVMAKGWYDPEYRQQIALARALAERLGDPKRLCWALYAQWVPLFNQAAHDLGREAAQEFMNTVERIDCNITKSMAFYCVGATGFCRGEFISARESLEQCLALDDPNEVQAIIAFAGRDNVVPTLGHLGQTYAFLGYFTKAKECLERSNNRGGLFSHAPSMAFAQHNRVILSLIFRDHPGARIATDAVLGLAGQHDLPLFRAFGEIYSNWLQVEAENGFDGVKRMRDGLIAYRDMGFRLFLPRWFYMLADAYRTTGQIEEGLRTIDQALSVIEETEERAYEAEIHRLKGELLLAASAANIDAAQSCFLRAMDVARRQSARTWELRAATSLARCLRMQTGGDAARAALAPIYAWFTDGFDLPDLTEARSLLQDLQE